MIPNFVIKTPRERLFLLVQKHSGKRNIPITELDSLFRRGSINFFVDIFGRIPVSKEEVRDAELMNRLYLQITDNPKKIDTYVTRLKQISYGGNKNG